MESKMIIMLTYNDVTVKNAKEIFESCKDIKEVEHWGFKNVGLSTDEMRDLVSLIKSTGKKSYLEVVTYNEEDCLKAAMLAVECGFDYLCGTIYFESVWQYLKTKSITYTPFIGKVYGSPSVLEGSADEIVEEAKSLEAKGIKGFDLLAYRHTEDPEGVAEACVNRLEGEVVMAGSVNSKARIETVNRINPWGFTMGTALFDSKFVEGGSFRENLIEVVNIMSAL